MNEIEKLYKSVGVEKFCNSDSEFCPVAFCKECNFSIYPSFNSEKQIELIKWLSQRRLLSVVFCEDKNTYQFFNEKCTGAFCKDLATSIATLVQCELDSCTEQEKEQVRDILKG